jgi:hypothetical protein
MAKEFAAGCPYRDLADGLGQRLARLGVSGASGQGADVLVAASSSLVDTMGKAGEPWTGGASVVASCSSYTSMVPVA